MRRDRWSLAQAGEKRRRCSAQISLILRRKNREKRRRRWRRDPAVEAGWGGRGPADLRGLDIVRVDVTAFGKMRRNHPPPARPQILPDCCSFSLLLLLCETAVKIIQ